MFKWERSQFESGGSNALVMFVIYGEFTEDLSISRKEYRTAGIPPSVTLRKLSRAQQREFPFTDAEFGKGIGAESSALFEKLRELPQCLILQGEVTDPPDLNYLRDTVGVITFFLDHGGTAVMDPQQFKLYDRSTWRREVFEPQQAELSEQVVILWSEEPGGTKWFHTRGLRKFGRPDLSIRTVRPEHEPGVKDLFQRFINLQIQGGHIPQGKEISMASLPSGLICHHEGSHDDPDFNNVHVEIRRAVR